MGREGIKKEGEKESTRVIEREQEREREEEREREKGEGRFSETAESIVIEPIGKPCNSAPYNLFLYQDYAKITVKTGGNRDCFFNFTDLISLMCCSPFRCALKAKTISTIFSGGFFILIFMPY